MPYASKEELPETVKKLPKHAQNIFMSAFNSALKQYKDEKRAFQTAWAAVSNRYSKNDKGEWVLKYIIL